MCSKVGEQVNFPMWQMNRGKKFRFFFFFYSGDFFVVLRFFLICKLFLVVFISIVKGANNHERRARVAITTIMIEH